MIIVGLSAPGSAAPTEPSAASMQTPAAATTPALSSAPTPSPALRDNIEALCSHHGKPLPGPAQQLSSKQHVPRFTLHASGEFELTSPTDAQLWIGFAGLEGSAVARIEATPLDGQKPIAWCFAVDVATSYLVEPSPGSTVTILLYGQADSPPRGLVETRTAVLAKAEQVERVAVHRTVGIDAMIRSSRALFARGNTITGHEVSATMTHAKAVLGHLEILSGTWGCPHGRTDEPLAAAVCDETAKVMISAAQVIAILDRVSSNPNLLRTDERLFKDYYETLPALLAGLKTGEPTFRDAEVDAECETIARLRWFDTSTMLRLVSRATVPVVSPDRLVLVRFGSHPHTKDGADTKEPWGLTVTGVPTGTKMTFAAGIGKPISIDPTAVVAVLKSAIAMVPAGAAVIVGTKSAQLSLRETNVIQHTDIRRPRTKSLVCTVDSVADKEAILRELLKHAVGEQTLDVPQIKQLDERIGKSPRAQNTVRGKSRDDIPPPLAKAKEPNLELDQLTARFGPGSTQIDEKTRADLRELYTRYQQTYEAATQRLFEQLSADPTVAEAIYVAAVHGKPGIPWMIADTTLAPTAATETVGRVFSDLDPKHVDDLVACASDACTVAVDDKNVRARATLTPDRSKSWTLIAEVTGGMSLKSRYSASCRCLGLFELLGPPSFEPVNRGDGPDQVFELQTRSDPRNMISTSLILGRYYSDRWLLGFGPSLLVGTSGGAFTQWNMRFAYRLSNKGAYLTFGPSLRFLPDPVDYQLHDRVSVTKSASGTATPPQIRTYYSPELQLDIGLGIDIGSLGAAASDTIKSFGGK